MAQDDRRRRTRVVPSDLSNLREDNSVFKCQEESQRLYDSRNYSFNLAETFLLFLNNNHRSRVDNDVAKSSNARNCCGYTIKDTKLISLKVDQNFLFNSLTGYK